MRTDRDAYVAPFAHLWIYEDCFRFLCHRKILRFLPQVNRDIMVLISPTRASIKYVWSDEIVEGVW